MHFVEPNQQHQHGGGGGNGSIPNLHDDEQRFELSQYSALGVQHFTAQYKNDPKALEKLSRRICVRVEQDSSDLINFCDKRIRKRRKKKKHDDDVLLKQLQEELQQLQLQQQNSNASKNDKKQQIIYHQQQKQQRQEHVEVSPAPEIVAASELLLGACLGQGSFSSVFVLEKHLHQKKPTSSTAPRRGRRSRLSRKLLDGSNRSQSQSPRGTSFDKSTSQSNRGASFDDYCNNNNNSTSNRSSTRTGPRQTSLRRRLRQRYSGNNDATDGSNRSRSLSPSRSKSIHTTANNNNSPRGRQASPKNCGSPNNSTRSRSLTSSITNGIRAVFGGGKGDNSSSNHNSSSRHDTAATAQDEDEDDHVVHGSSAIKVLRSQSDHLHHAMKNSNNNNNNNNNNSTSSHTSIFREGSRSLSCSQNRRRSRRSRSRDVSHAADTHIGNNETTATTTDDNASRSHRGVLWKNFEDIDGTNNSSSSDGTNSNLVVKILQPKLMKQPKLFANCAAGLIREGLFLAAIDHPHILKVHAWTSPNGWMDFAALNASKEGDLYDGYLLVLERLNGGSLKGWMRKWHDDHADEQRAIAQVASMKAAAAAAAEEKNNNSNRSFQRLSFTASSSRDDSNSKSNSFSFSNHRQSSRLRHTVLKKENNDDDDDSRQPLLSPEDEASISPGSASTRDFRSSDRPFMYTSSWPTTQLSDRTSLLLQLSDTVKYLHKHRILHRDLKPDNLGVTFVDEPQVSNISSSKERQYPTTLSLKVFDFDIARLVPEDPKKVDELSLLSSHKRRKVKRTASNGSMQSFEPSTRNNYSTRDVRSMSPSRSSHAMTGDKHGSNHRRRAKKSRGQRPGRQGSNHIDASSETAAAASPKQDALFEMTAKMGSPRYMAPEIARGEPYNLRSEVYTVCLLVHEVLTLQKPYDELAPENHSKLVHFDLPGYRPPVFSSWGWPTELQDVLHRGWGDITQRPSMKEVHSVLKRALPKLCPELVQQPPLKAQAAQTTSTVATKLSTTEQQPPLSKSQLQPTLAQAQKQIPPQKEPKKKGRGLFHRTPKKSGKSRKPRSASLTPTASNSDISMSNDEPLTTVGF